MHAREEASPPSSAIGNVPGNSTGTGIGTGIGTGTDIGAEIGNVTVTHVVRKPERNSKRPTMPASPDAKKVREAGGMAGVALALLLATAGKASAADVSLEAAPPQPVVAPTPAAEAVATKDQGPGAEEETERPVKVGAAGGIGFPRPLSVEGFVTVKRYLLVGAEYSVLPKFNVGGTDTTMWALAADARVFPFGGAFFIGVRGGRQHLGTRTTVTVTGLGSRSDTLDVDTWFLNPRMGFAWTWSSGFTLGIDAGVQIPLKSAVSSSLPAEALADSRVTRVSDLFGKRVLPTVDLLRLGFVL